MYGYFSQAKFSRILLDRKKKSNTPMKDIRYTICIAFIVASWTGQSFTSILYVHFVTLGAIV